MVLPQLGHKYGQERRGISATISYAADNGQVFRETPTGDVGIDGQLEYVNPEGFATGRIVAVQAKSGPSWFTHPTASGWSFYPEEKHRQYWESFALPVILVLHNPATKKSYWVDVRQALRSDHTQKAIEVPKANVLSDTAVETLFENAGVTGQPFIESLDGLLEALLRTTSGEASFPLSYFELFVKGLTNFGRSLYYGMDVIMATVEEALSVKPSTFGLGIDEKQQDFAFGFVQFVVGQNLAHIDYADCLIDWIDHMSQPQFVAPLTSRGKALVAFVTAQEDRLVGAGKLEPSPTYRVAQESYFEMIQSTYGNRGPRIRAFAQTWTKDG